MCSHDIFVYRYNKNKFHLCFKTSHVNFVQYYIHKLSAFNVILYITTYVFRCHRQFTLPDSSVNVYASWARSWAYFSYLTVKRIPASLIFIIQLKHVPHAAVNQYRRWFYNAKSGKKYWLEYFHTTGSRYLIYVPIKH